MTFVSECLSRPYQTPISSIQIVSIQNRPQFTMSRPSTGLLVVLYLFSIKILHLEKYPSGMANEQWQQIRKNIILNLKFQCGKLK